jgi:hypothetical protein
MCRTEPIQTIQYSPDNKMVAIGSRDNFIYVYRVDDGGARYSRVGKCLVSTSTVLPVTIHSLYTVHTTIKPGLLKPWLAKPL